VGMNESKWLAGLVVLALIFLFLGLFALGMGFVVFIAGPGPNLDLDARMIVVYWFMMFGIGFLATGIFLLRKI